MNVSKQYIQWYDTEDKAWEVAIGLSKLIRSNSAQRWVLVSVERYEGKWWVITVPNRPE